MRYPRWLTGPKGKFEYGDLLRAALLVLFGTGAGVAIWQGILAMGGP